MAIAAEPADFDALVRTPGMAFLALLAPNQPVNFDGKEYWRRISRELYESYRGICAYTAHHIARDTGFTSVEHFIAKSADRFLAYEWSNYRLVCGRLNGHKGNHADVLDPFTIEPETFVLQFPSLLLRPGPQLQPEVHQKAKLTIRRLKLNESPCYDARLDYIRLFIEDRVSFEYLEEYAPFIAFEIWRQGVATSELLGNVVGFLP